MKNANKTNKSLFWPALEATPFLNRSAMEWKGCLGADFDWAKNFLSLQEDLARFIPCPARPPCGCDHAVVEHDRDDLVAVCRCERRRCPTVPLNREDALVYALDFHALGKAICKALDIHSRITAAPGMQATYRIGTFSPWAGVDIPVYFSVQCDASSYIRVGEGLIARNDKPFVLLTPTATACGSGYDAIFKKQKILFLPLDKILRWNDKFITKEVLGSMVPNSLWQKTHEYAMSKGNGKLMDPENAEIYKLHHESSTLQIIDMLHDEETKVIARPDFNQRNDRVITFLAAHDNANRPFDLDMLIEEELRSHDTAKGTPPAKPMPKLEIKVGDFHIIVNKLNFTGVLRCAFWTVSKNSIQLHNPLTRKRIKYLKDAKGRPITLNDMRKAFLAIDTIKSHNSSQHQPHKKPKPKSCKLPK